MCSKYRFFLGCLEWVFFGGIIFYRFVSLLKVNPFFWGGLRCFFWGFGMFFFWGYKMVFMWGVSKCSEYMSAKNENPENPEHMPVKSKNPDTY